MSRHFAKLAKEIFLVIKMNDTELLDKLIERREKKLKDDNNNRKHLAILTRLIVRRTKLTIEEGKR